MNQWERDELVTVPPQPFVSAALMETYRLGSNLENRRKDKYVRNLWCSDLAIRTGSHVAEWCVCKVTDRHHSGLDGIRSRDTTVGEVKWHRNEMFGLFLPESQLIDDEHYWLVLGEPPKMRVIGSMVGRDVYAAGRRYATNGRPPGWVVRASHILGWKVVPA